MRMTWNGKTTKAIGKIASGVKSIVAGVFGTLSTVEHIYTDLRFWLEGRDWDLSFGPVYGEKGTTQTLIVHPQCYFRGEKILATDTCGWEPKVSVPTANKRSRSKQVAAESVPTVPHENGCGTRITQILVGQRLQRPATGGGVLTKFFSQGAFGNGVQWDATHPALAIAVTVSFVESCTFDMVVFGRAVV